MPDMKPVMSSNIEAIGYDGPKRELHVRFHGGGYYVYHDVTPETAASLKAAPSKGTFLNQRVKGKHKHSKIGAPQ